ncbi:MAG: hypothetical protein K5930_07015 [Treponemataceae bacterium]|nr:hypothetical protein [Treponemataceae bacterium]
MSGPIIFTGSCIVCFLAFASVGIYALKRKDPMNFWSGSKVPAELVIDIKKYNRANGIMWLVYSVLFLLNIPFAFVDLLLAGMILGGVCVIGLPLLIFIYSRISKKYIVGGEIPLN